MLQHDNWPEWAQEWYIARFLCEGGEPSRLINNELHSLEYLFRSWQSFIWTRNYALYRTRSFLIIFTGSRCLDLFRLRWIQTLRSNAISLSYLLISSSDMSLGLWIGLSSVQIVVWASRSFLLATCLVYNILLGLNLYSNVRRSEHVLKLLVM
jgi:hypothetical protein